MSIRAEDLGDVFDRLTSRLKGQYIREVVGIAGVVARNHADMNIKAQGYEGRAWPKRADTSKRPTGDMLLVDTGIMRTSLRVEPTPTGAALVSKTPYAKRHNEGLKGMPERRFIGNSPTLNKKIDKEVDEYTQKLVDRIIN